jgi:hypothetical protein
MPTSPTLRLDPRKVADVAARGLARLQRDDPEQFVRIGDAVEAGGGGMFSVTLLSDGTVVLALAGMAVARCPRGAVERGTARMFT